MAIPISEYISITDKVIANVVGERDFSGLVFSKVAMKTGAPKKTDYDAGKVVQLYRGDVDANFDDADYAEFLGKYFSYSGGTKRTEVINVVLVDNNEGAGDAFARVTGGDDGFCNFGSFTFYGTVTGINELAVSNNGNEYGWVCIVGTNASSQATDAAALKNLQLVHLTHAPMEAMAWYASVDYSKPNSAGTIDYKQFGGSVPTVTTADAKHTADSLKVNYIGLVQNYGNGMSFYQKGVNMDGTDLGVVRDMCWMNFEICKAYFNAQNSNQKIPANYGGAAIVKNLVIGVAVRAIDNGSILVDKPLSTDQIAAITAYTGDVNAADAVQNTGYYVNVSLVGKTCQYTLIYGSGDHIGKVSGIHVLA